MVLYFFRLAYMFLDIIILFWCLPIWESVLFQLLLTAVVQQHPYEVNQSFHFILKHMQPCNSPFEIQLIPATKANTANTVHITLTPLLLSITSFITSCTLTCFSKALSLTRQPATLVKLLRNMALCYLGWSSGKVTSTVASMLRLLIFHRRINTKVIRRAVWGKTSKQYLRKGYGWKLNNHN